MAAPPFDLRELDSVDLASLKLGAQVMRHKAELAARPHVETFFTGVAMKVDEELARRQQDRSEGLRIDPAAAVPLVGAADLPLVGLASAASASAPTDDDRRLAAEYLELLGANDRLSEPVRHAVRRLREHLGPDD